MRANLRSRDLEVLYYEDHFVANLRGRSWYFPRYIGRRCDRCGNPLETGSRHETCGACRKFKDVETVHYIGLYSKDRKDDLARGIWRLKENGQGFYAEIFGMMLSLVLENEAEDLRGNSVLAAVPTHPEDHPGRTYNPPELIARHISRHADIPYLDGLLVKTRPNSQKKLRTQAQRFSEVEGAFAPLATLSGERVLLVDDVMTSGATLAACGQCCLRAGG